MQYDELTPAQKAQADYLFADIHFGTDPRAYLYEVDKGGDVIRRSIRPAEQSKPEPRTKRARQSAPVTVTVIQEVNLPDEVIAHARMNMDALAASVAKTLYLSQTQEVNHE